MTDGDRNHDPNQDAVEQVKQRGLESTVDLKDEQARERHETPDRETEPEDYSGDVKDTVDGEVTNADRER